MVALEAGLPSRLIEPRIKPSLAWAGNLRYGHAMSGREARIRGRGTLVCIPTYNELDNIEGIVAAVLESVPEAHVLVIDDNSPDGTGRWAEAHAQDESRLKVLHRPKKEGLGRAYLAGFVWALQRDYQRLFQLDADFSHDPAYLPGFLELLETHDVVVGSRRVTGGGIEDWNFGRRLLSWGGSFYARTVLAVPIRDLTGGFNGFRREVLERLNLAGIESRGYGFQVELKYRCVRQGFDVIEAPIVFPDRRRGQSKMGLGIIGEAMIGVMRLRYRAARRWDRRGD